MKITITRSLRSQIISLLGALLAAATGAIAATSTWTGADVATSTTGWDDSNNWSPVAIPASGNALVFTGSAGLNNGNDIKTSFSIAGLTFAPGAGAFVLGGDSVSTSASFTDNSPNLETIDFSIVLPATHSIYVTGDGSMQINSIISGSGFGITKTGPGLLTLTGEAAGANSYTGPTAINAGTLTLDFSQGGSTPPANIVAASSALSLGGGALNILAGSSVANSQTFNGATVASGLSVVSAAPASGGSNPTLTLGANTDTAGAVVEWVGPATIGSDGGAVSATATITTTTAGGGGVGLFGGNGTTSGAYATVGLYDWASTDLASGTNTGGAGTSPYTIIGGSQVTGFYSPFGTGNNSLAGNADFTAATAGSHNTDNCGSMRFNVAGGCTVNPTGIVTTGGILVTPAVGAANVTLNGSGDWQPSRGGASTMVLWQNNIAGFLIANAANTFNDAKSGAGTYVLAGSGTVEFTATNDYTGPTFIDGGAVAYLMANALGAIATGAAVTLNGGTICGGATFALDNAGANKRPIALGGNGGGLAAATGTTMTVDGVISGAAGTGPLIIGIPASAANGNTAGLLPGSGSGTANTNPVIAAGTVSLTAANTYYGGTVIASGTLRINGQYALGGADYGGLVISNGTLQYAPSFSGNGSGDLSILAGLTLAGAATIDLNGNNVTYANSIGNLGAGSMTVTNGTLTLDGASAYSGGTTVANFAGLIVNNTTGSATGTGPVTVDPYATLGGAGAIVGNVTWLPGALAGFTQGSPMTISGAITLNSNTVTVNVPGTTPLPIGSYTLMNYTDVPDSAGSFNPAPVYAGAGVAAATISTISTSGGVVSLSVTSSGGVSGVWDSAADGNWSSSANWLNGVVPGKNPGDAALFGVSSNSSLTTVNLDQNETVGEITMTNANSFAISNSGGYTLALNNGIEAATIIVTAGTANSIQTAVSVTNAVDVTVSAGAALSIPGAIANADPTGKNPGTLVVNAAGTFALSGNNSYGPQGPGAAGTTFGGGGLLQVGSSAALGLGDLDILGPDNSTLQAGASVTLGNNIDIGTGAIATVDSQGYAITLSGAISDSGSLTKIGGGTLTLSGANSYSGLTTLNAGIVSISADNNLGGSAETAVVLNGGDLLGAPGASLQRNINIGPAAGATGATALLDAAAGGTFTINGVIASDGNSGANNLVVNSQTGSTGTLELEGADTFTGFTVISNGTLMVGNTAALQNSTVNYNNQGGTLAFDGNLVTAATFGALSGSQNLALTNTSGTAVALTLGGNNASTTYSGILNDSGAGASLTKTGTGTLILKGANTYSGNTTGSGGILNITNGGAINGGGLRGSGFVVDGGSVTCSATTTLGAFNNNFLETAGAVNVQAFNPEGNVDGSLIEITGGYFSATSMDLSRSGANTTAPTATAPVAAPTGNGLYIDSTNLSDPAVVNLGSLVFGDSNSSAAARMDAGSLTITNQVEVGAITDGSARWTILQINGGVFTNQDTVNGIVLSQNGAGFADDAEAYFSGGKSYVGVINFGAASDTAGGQGFVIITNAALYMGAGGINLANTTGLYTNIISLLGGTLGATTNWSTALPMLLDGTSFTIQAGDPSGNSWNITNSGNLSGAGKLVKTGGGILVLSGSNTWTGATTISNGTFALSGDGVHSGVLLGTPDIAIISPGLLDPSGLTNDGTLHIGDPSEDQPAQILTGNGSVNSNLFVGALGRLSPGLAAAYGNLTVSNNVAVSGAITLRIDQPSAGVTNDSVTAGSLTINPGATLTVTQGANDLHTGDTFHLFNIAGNTGYTAANLTLTLPTTAPVSGTNYVWDTNNLAVNGTLLLATGVPNVNLTPTNITFSFSAGNLTLGWPASQIGWRLLMQSNPAGVGLLTNPSAWATVPGSTNVNQEIIPVGAANQLFFQLVYP
jgi:autotransporter-associated beta strand protein